LDDVGHAVADHVGADGAVGVDVEGFEGVQEMRMHSMEVKWSGEDLHVEFFRGQAGPVGYAGVFAGRESFPGVRAFQQEVGRWVFGAFASAQPTA
jgi:hypothetical protein